MSNSIFKEYIKGEHRFSEFNPDKCRTGTHIAIVDALGGDRIPLTFDFDYRTLDTDLIYIWFQGGVPNDSAPLEVLKKLRANWDGVLLINWEEVYWLTDAYCVAMFNKYLEGTKYVDAVVSGFHDFDKRMEKIGIDVPWRYLVTPYDTEWLRHKFYDTPKSSPKRIYSTIHGRSVVCDRAVAVMNSLKDLDYELVLNRYRFVMEKAIREKITRRVGISDLSFFDIISPIEPWGKYMKYMAESYMFIDEYPAYSQSHTTIDAACGGTPTMSHSLNSSAVTCFPDLIVDDRNNSMDWLKLTDKLLKDEDFYNDARSKAYEAVIHYGIKSFRDQLVGLYKELKR